MTAPPRFTPSLMSHEVLERLFVARDRTLDAVMDRIDAAVNGNGRNHTLLVGPRGAGKTHLVSLVYHRTKRLRADGARLQLAWLPEDPWTINSYRHLLTAIATRTEPAFDGEIPRATEELEVLLAQRAAEGGPIVVIVENLDQILETLGNEGQQRLRHLLQADRSLLLVATSTRLDRALSDQASPFYGFFTTTRLEPFDTDEAAAMLTAIAADRHDDKLVGYLASEEGHTRLRTICHLAGGQPRMWAALSSALTVEGLGELVELLLARFDDLTPYYQEQLARLSGQQRLVVAELAELDRPINVKELAERLEVDQKSLSKTMSELVDRGWAMPVTSTATALLDRRRTYYELAEPLARLSFQIKESRGEPLRLVVEFLKHWFEPEDLMRPQPEGLAMTYLLVAREGQLDPVVATTRQLQSLPTARGPAVELLEEIETALIRLDTDDGEPFLRLPTPARAVLEQKLQDDGPAAVRLEIHSLALDEFGFSPHPAVTTWIEHAENLVRVAPDSFKAYAQLELASWLGCAWRFEEAYEVLASAKASGIPVDESVLSTEMHVVQSYWEAGHVEEAIAASESLVARHASVLGPEHPNSLSSRRIFSGYLRLDGQGDRAVEAIRDLPEIFSRIHGVEAPVTLKVQGELSRALAAAERYDEAIAVGSSALGILERTLGPDGADTIDAVSDLADALIASDHAPEAISLLRPRIEGEHRATWLTTGAGFSAQRKLVMAYLMTDQPDEALKLGQTLNDDQRRVLGPAHPDTLTMDFTIGTLLVLEGRRDQGVELMTIATASASDALGVDHVFTKAMASSLDEYRSSMPRSDQARRET